MILIQIAKSISLLITKEYALHNAIKLLVHAYNQLQLYAYRFPFCNPHLMSFVAP